MINIIYSYYLIKDENRKYELNYCFNKLLNNKHIDIVTCIAENDLEIKNSKLNIINVDKRQTYKEILNKGCLDNYVNVLINSDCFLQEDGTELLNKIKYNQFWAISRWNIINLEPLVLGSGGKEQSQDCWVIRGIPKENINLNYYMGIRGCDNRIAWEFNHAGYNVNNPSLSIKVYHLHTNPSSHKDPAVPPPYLRVKACQIKDIR